MKIIQTVPIFFATITILTASDNPFLKLPVEVRDKIATYLLANDSESIEEAIERTRDRRYLLPGHEEILAKFSTKPHCYCYSVDNTKLMAIIPEKVRVYGERDEASIQMYDIARDTIQKHEQLSDLFRYLGFSINNMALSRSGSFFAEACRTTLYQPVPSTQQPMFRDAIMLRVIDVKKRVRQIDSLVVSDITDVVSIDFNKQETRLVIHHMPVYITNGSDKKEVMYTVVPLVAKNIDDERVSKTFDRFVIRRCICKPFDQRERERFQVAYDTEQNSLRLNNVKSTDGCWSRCSMQ